MTLMDPRLAYGSLPVLIWTAGPDGACDYLNQRWSELTGRPLAEMLQWGWVESLHPDDRDQVMAEYSAAVAAREPIRLEYRMLQVEGEYRWFLGTGEPVSDADGTFLGYSGCTSDITDRRALEQRLAQHGRIGEMTQLAGGIAHDFNNLITGILGHVTLLLDEASLAPEAQGGPGPDPPGSRPRGHPHPTAPLVQPASAPVPALPRPQPAGLRDPKRHPPGGGSGGRGPVRAGG